MYGYGAGYPGACCGGTPTCGCGCTGIILVIFVLLVIVLNTRVV
jgi:hypothetical protein